MSYPTHVDKQGSATPTAIGALAGGGLGALLGYATADHRHRLRNTLASGALGAGLGGTTGILMSSDNEDVSALTQFLLANGLLGGAVGLTGGVGSSAQSMKDTRGLREQPIAFQGRDGMVDAEEADELELLDTRDSFKAASEGQKRDRDPLSRGWAHRAAFVIPGAALSMTLGGLGGYSVGRQLMDSYRKRRMLEDLRQAEDDLDTALAEQQEAFELRREKLGREKKAFELGTSALAALTLASLGIGGLTYSAALKRMRKNDKHRQQIKALEDFEQLEQDRYMGDIEDRISDRF